MRKLLFFLCITFQSAHCFGQYDLEKDFNFNVNDYVRFRKQELFQDQTQFTDYLITINSFKVLSKSECTDCKVYVIKGLVEQDIITYYNDYNRPTSSFVLHYLPYQDTLYACLSNPSGLDNFLLRKQNMPDLFPRTATPADDEYLNTPGTTTPISELILDNTQVYEGLPNGTLIGTFNQVVVLESVCDVPDDNNHFTIANNKLYVRVPLDYHLKPTYNIHVKVNSGKGQPRRKMFTINALDGGGNHAPTDLGLSTTSITFNAYYRTKVANITFADEDANDTHRVTLVSGPGSNNNFNFYIRGGNELWGDINRHLDNALDTAIIRIRVADDKNGVTEKSLKIKLEKGTSCTKPVVTQVGWNLQASSANTLGYVWFAQGKRLGYYSSYKEITDFSLTYTAAAYYEDGCIAESDSVVPVFPITPPYDGCAYFKVTISDNDNSMNLTAVPSQPGFTLGNSHLFWQRDGINLPAQNSFSIVADQPGTYTAILYNTCATTASKTVSLSTCPKPVITRNGNTLKSTLGEGFNWYFNNTPLESHGQSITISDMGYYSVEVQYPSGCRVKSNPFLVSWLGDDCLAPHIIVTNDVNLTTEPASTYGWFINDFFESTFRDIKMKEVGSYFVKVTYQNGCSRISNELIVDQCSFFPKAVEVDVNGNTLTCKTKKSIVSSYTWYRNDVELPETDSSIVVAESGTYKVKVTYKNSPCSVTSEPHTITAVEDNWTLKAFTVFPNPGIENFWISSGTKAGLVRVTVFASNGKVIFSNYWDTARLSLLPINLNHVSSGMYLIRISDGISFWSQRLIRY
jgi:hypothetical protein